MAKRKTATTGRKGGGDLAEQIAKLSKTVGRKGVLQADTIREECSPDVLGLAYKMMRQEQRKLGQGGLGSRIETILAAIKDPKVREQTRAAMTEGKTASQEA